MTFAAALAEESRWLADIRDQQMPTDSGRRVYIGPTAPVHDPFEIKSAYAPETIAREASIRSAIAKREAKAFKSFSAQDSAFYGRSYRHR